MTFQVIFIIHYICLRTIIHVYSTKGKILVSAVDCSYSGEKNCNVENNFQNFYCVSFQAAKWFVCSFGAAVGCCKNLLPGTLFSVSLNFSCRSMSPFPHSISHLGSNYLVRYTSHYELISEAYHLVDIHESR